MKTSELDDPQEKEYVLKREQQFIIDSLHNDDSDSLPDSTQSSQEAGYISCDEAEDDQNSEITTTESTESKESRCLSVSSNDGGYISSEEDKLSKDNIVVLNIDHTPNTILQNQIYFTKEQKIYYNLPKDLQILVDAVNYGLPASYEVPIEDKPKWLDINKFKLGQKFAIKYYFGLNYSEMLSLLMLFSFPDTLHTLIYSGNSGAPFTAYKRYLSTVHRVKSWFEDDIWDKNSTGYKNLKAVRAMHLNISKRVNSETEEGLNEKLRKEAGLWCPMNNDLKDDFKSLCPVFKCSYDSLYNNKIYVNQCEMSITQFGFFGLMLMHPEKFGAGNASKEELDGFIHVWRVLGYFLGIDDKYNFCQGSTEDVRKRCKDMIDYWVKPNFSSLSQDWEHMSRCLIEGISYYVPGLTFEVSLMYLCWVLGIDAPRLNSSLTWGQYLMFNILKLVMCFTLRIPGVMALHNLVLHWMLKKAQNKSPEQLKRLENKVYTFQTPDCLNTKL